MMRTMKRDHGIKKKKARERVRYQTLMLELTWDAIDEWGILQVKRRVDERFPERLKVAHREMCSRILETY